MEEKNNSEPKIDDILTILLFVLRRNKIISNCIPSIYEERNSKYRFTIDDLLSKDGNIRPMDLIEKEKLGKILNILFHGGILCTVTDTLTNITYYQIN